MNKQKRKREKIGGFSPFQGQDQCDQMAGLFFNIWPNYKNENSPNAI